MDLSSLPKAEFAFPGPLRDKLVAEGEGHTTVAEWRVDHETFWHSQGMRNALDDPTFTVDDTTPVVLKRFRVVADLSQ